MSRADRAKQFAPFDALKGLQEALRLKEYEHERSLKGDIQEEKILEISSVIKNLKKNDLVEVVFFEDGYNKKIKGKSIVDIIDGFIKINEKVIKFDNILDITLLDIV